MANEIEILVENAAGDGWVDASPGPIDTGYQNQNVGFTSLFNGLDNSAASISGSSLVLSPSGIIDVDGIPYVIKSTATISLPTSGPGIWYIKLADGTTELEKTPEFTSSRGTYSAAKNGWYSATGERVLNIAYDRLRNAIVRLDSQDMRRGTIDRAMEPNAYINTEIFNRLAWGTVYRLFDPALGFALITGLSYDTTNNKIIVLMGADRTVNFYNSDFSLSSTITLPAGLYPNGAAFDHDNGDMIMSETTDVFRMDGVTNTISSQFSTGISMPDTSLGGCAFDPTTRYLHIAYGTTVAIFDYDAGTLVSSNSIGTSVYGIEYDPNYDCMILLMQSSPRLSIYDKAYTNEIERIYLPGDTDPQCIMFDYNYNNLMASVSWNTKFGIYGFRR